MVTTVTGPVGATYDAVFAGLTATLVRTGGVVGYGPSGGAIAPDQKTYTTDGSGVLTMADLKPGKYELTLFVPINEGVSQTVLWKAAGTVLPDAGENITLSDFLDRNVEPITPSLVQEAIAAAARAEAAADEAEAVAETLGTLSELEDLAERGEDAEAGAVAARDATQLAALSQGYYPDVASGEAALTDDDVFFTDDDDFAVYYQIVSGSAEAIEGLRVPLEAAYDALDISAQERDYQSQVWQFLADVDDEILGVPIFASDDGLVILSTAVSGDALAELVYRENIWVFLAETSLPENAPIFASEGGLVLLSAGQVGGGVSGIATLYFLRTNEGQSNGEGQTDDDPALVYPNEMPGLLTMVRGSTPAERDQWLNATFRGDESEAIDPDDFIAIAQMGVVISGGAIPGGDGTTAAEAASRTALYRGIFPIITWSNAERGQQIEDMLEGAAEGEFYFQNAETALTRAVELIPSGSQLVWDWTLMHQGEGNAGTANLGELHDQLRSELDAMARPITGQPVPLRMISWQPSSMRNATNVLGNSAGARSILSHAIDPATIAQGLFICGGPSYGFPWFAGVDDTDAVWLHHASIGHAMRGEAGDAIIRRFEIEGQYLPLHAVSAAVTGANEITVQLSEPAVIDADDANVDAITNSGVTLSGGDVSSLSLSGDTLMIQTTGAAASVTAVNIAMSGHPSSGSRVRASVPRSNIRAKRTLGAYSFGGLIKAWACHQQITVS